MKRNGPTLMRAACAAVLLSALAVSSAGAQVVGLAVDGGHVRPGLTAALHAGAGTAGMTLGGSAGIGVRSLEVTGWLAKSFRDPGSTSNASARGLSARIRLLDGATAGPDLTLLGGVGRSSFGQHCVQGTCDYISHWFPVGLSIGTRLGSDQSSQVWAAPRLDFHRLVTLNTSGVAVPAEKSADFGLSAGFDAEVPMRISFAFDLRRRGDLPSAGAGPEPGWRTSVSIGVHFRYERPRGL